MTPLWSSITRWFIVNWTQLAVFVQHTYIELALVALFAFLMLGVLSYRQRQDPNFILHGLQLFGFLRDVEDE